MDGTFKNSIMKKQFVTTIFSILITASLAAQVQSVVLNDYITQALESNLALQQKEMSYEKSLAALQEAKSMFWPKPDPGIMHITAFKNHATRKITVSHEQ